MLGTRSSFIGLVVAAALVLAGCAAGGTGTPPGGPGSAGSPSTASTPTGPVPVGTLKVDAFYSIAGGFGGGGDCLPLFGYGSDFAAPTTDLTPGRWIGDAKPTGSFTVSAGDLVAITTSDVDFSAVSKWTADIEFAYALGGGCYQYDTREIATVTTGDAHTVLVTIPADATPTAAPVLVSLYVSQGKVHSGDGYALESDLTSIWK